MEILLICIYFVLAVIFSISAIQNKKSKNIKEMVLNVLTAVCFGLAGIIHSIKL